MPHFSMRHFSGSDFCGVGSRDSVAESPVFSTVQQVFAVSIGKMKIADLCIAVFLCQIYQTSHKGSPNDAKTIFRFPENKAISDSKKNGKG
jgi:hypothetical protein